MMEDEDDGRRWYTREEQLHQLQVGVSHRERGKMRGGRLSGGDVQRESETCVAMIKENLCI
jgi:hypothetical protein